MLEEKRNGAQTSVFHVSLYDFWEGCTFAFMSFQHSFSWSPYSQLIPDLTSPTAPSFTSLLFQQVLSPHPASQPLTVCSSKPFIPAFLLVGGALPSASPPASSCSLPTSWQEKQPEQSGTASSSLCFTPPHPSAFSQDPG